MHIINCISYAHSDSVSICAVEYKQLSSERRTLLSLKTMSICPSITLTINVGLCGLTSLFYDWKNDTTFKTTMYKYGNYAILLPATNCRCKDYI